MTQSPNAIGAGSSTNFIEFMLSQIDKILDDIPAQINEENHLLSDYVQKLLSVMEYDIPYTSSALMEKLDLKSKETFQKIIYILLLSLIWSVWPSQISPGAEVRNILSFEPNQTFWQKNSRGTLLPLYYANISPLKYEHRR